ncbi:MAG: FG-GAP-like repeat-containing protein [Myxococcota bacterium]
MREPPRIDAPTPEPDATIQTVDMLGHAIDGALEFDAIEEQRALAQVESSLFARAREPLQLSRYLLLRTLGSGSTGVVYDGYDPELARRVAVKVLRAGRPGESAARARARFVREAQSIARLSHPNVIAVHDVGTYRADELTPGTREGGPGRAGPDAGIFIVMELVEGHDLATWLEHHPRSWREVVDVFLAAGQGLAAAHAAGIVHRDFKPGNVLVGDDSRIKVVDFGLALTYSPGASSSVPPDTLTPTTAPPELLSLPVEDSVAMDKLTRTGVLLGTPAYMAPEQHRGEPADQKADQFAFCTSLYRALYGQHAYAGHTLRELFDSKVAARVRPAPDDRRVPAWVDRVVMRGLAPEPSDRFASMEDLLRALMADPARRRARLMRWSSVPLAVGALGYAGWLATRPGQVQVEVTAGGKPVPGVRIYVDEQELAGGRGEVPAGLHRVEVIAPDHEPAQTVLDVQRGGVHEVAVELRHEQGMFELELEPAGGHILIDGRDYGSRLRSLAVDTGPHELLLRHEGYVDERMEWTAVAGQTNAGFVALRKALAWSRPASGALLEAYWVGDANGDGLDDLVQRRFNLLTVYDPWNDREVSQVRLPPERALYRLCDTDGDGVRDIAVLSLDLERRELLLYDGRVRGRKPSPRWTVAVPAGTEPRVGLGAIACAPREGRTRQGGGARRDSRAPPEVAGADLWVAGLRPGALTAYTASGQARWVGLLPDEPVEVAVRRDPAGALAPVVAGLDGVYGLGPDGALRWSTALPVAPRTVDGAVDERWLREAWARVERMLPWVVAASLEPRPGQGVLVGLLARERGATVVALGGEEGDERWRDDVRARPVLRPGHTLGDVDGDGADDLLVLHGGQAPELALVSGRRGRPIWNRPTPTASSARLRARLLMIAPAPLVALGRMDGEPECLGLLDAITGTPYARHVLPRAPSSAVALADWDGDGRDDLVLGTADGVLRAFDTRLRPLGTVPLRIPASTIEASRDANADGFVDLLLEARGPAVVVGPKVRWDRRPLDAVRATPVVEDLDGDGALEVALFGMLGEAKQLEIIDARTGRVQASSVSRDTPTVIRPPALLPVERGFDLLAVGSKGLRRFSGTDATLQGSFDAGIGYASPTVADVDGDGQLEVIIVTWQDPGEIHVLDAQTLGLEWSASLGSLGSFGAPHVSDVDGDGEVEVVVATLDGRVVCLSATGQSQWVADVGARLNFEPTVADLRGDGTRQILVTPHHDDDPLVVLEGTDGRERGRWLGVATRRARPQVSDVDRDGRPEIFVSSRTRGLLSLDGEGAVRWRHRFVDPDGHQAGGAGSPVVVDLDGDGWREVIAGFEDGSLHVVDAMRGDLVWRFDTGREEIEASPAVGDVDGDGRQEVFVAGHDRNLFCLDHGPGPRGP